jgi:hypothetical protein
MVIVNPDIITGPLTLKDGLGKLPVNISITVPVLGIEVTQGLKIVEDGPDNFVGESIVEVVSLLRGQSNRMDPVPKVLAGFLKLSIQIFDPLLLYSSGPANPDSSSLSQDWSQGGHKATYAWFDLPFPFAVLGQLKRQPV